MAGGLEGARGHTPPRFRNRYFFWPHQILDASTIDPPKPKILVPPLYINLYFIFCASPISLPPPPRPSGPNHYRGDFSWKKKHPSSPGSGTVIRFLLRHAEIINIRRVAPRGRYSTRGYIYVNNTVLGPCHSIILIFGPFGLAEERSCLNVTQPAEACYLQLFVGVTGRRKRAGSRRTCPQFCVFFSPFLRRPPRAFFWIQHRVSGDTLTRET